ncbi:MAG: HEAT repeat domain-containing protein [Candidatus Sumerlaeia bacterium]|nr:HEAT repeat domain-containing protein [Candidatus Sumerlaeia bacterium]
MTSSDESYRWQFEKLLKLFEQGPREELEDLCHKILVRGNDLLEPLADFLQTQPDHPRLAIVLELMGKIGDPRAATVLVQYLDSHARELRVQAAIALGWLRARLALEKLDKLEGHDPDEEVRAEARIALEEILREYPALRQVLRHHESLAFEESALGSANEEEFEGLHPLAPETQKQLAALFPRVLALRYRAVPLGIGSNGVVSFAILAEEAPETIGQDLKRLTGREVELHSWPESRLFEHLLTFYRWGDDDWVKLRQQPGEEAAREIAEILLAKVDPELPNPPLPDCVDSIEAVQSFLSLCLREQVVSAMVQCDHSCATYQVLVHTRRDESIELEPPLPPMRERFLRVLQVLAGCACSQGTSREVAQGSIRFCPANSDRPCLIDVTCETVGTRDVVALEFLDPEAN